MNSALLACGLALITSCATTTHSSQDQPAPTSAAATSESNTIYKVIPLQYAAAPDLAITLRGSLVTHFGRPSPRVVPDERTNSVVVACGPDELASIEQLIKDLDIQVKKP